MQTRTKTSLKRLMALVLSLALLMSLVPVTVAGAGMEHEDFTPFQFPGGPIFGTPQIIRASVPGDSQNLFLTITGDRFLMDTPFQYNENVTNLDYWFFWGTRADAAIVDFYAANPTAGSYGNATGFELVEINFIDPYNVYLHVRGYWDAPFYHRFYIIPSGQILESGRTPQPQIIYISDRPAPTPAPAPGDIGFQVIVPPSGAAPSHLAGPTEQGEAFPFGVNPRDFIWVRLYRNNEDGLGFTALAEDLVNWKVSEVPILSAPTVPIVPSHRVTLPAGTGSDLWDYSELNQETFTDYTGLTLIRAEWGGNAGTRDFCFWGGVDTPDEMLLVFRGSDILGGPFPLDFYHPNCLGDCLIYHNDGTGGLNVPNYVNGRFVPGFTGNAINPEGCAWCLTAEEIAHRVFIRAFAAALEQRTGADLDDPTCDYTVHYEDVGGEELAGIPIDIPALPMSLEIMNVTWGMLGPGLVPEDGSARHSREIDPGFHPGQSQRTIIVRATLLNPLSSFSSDANNLENWRIAMNDISYLAVGEGGTPLIFDADGELVVVDASGLRNDSVRGLRLEEVNVVPGTRVAELTLRTVVDTPGRPGPTTTADYTDDFTASGVVITGGVNTFHGPDSLINTVYTIEWSGSGQVALDATDGWPYAVQSGVPTRFDTAPYNIYIRALAGAITVPSTVMPHREPTGWHTHQVGSGNWLDNSSHRLDAPFLTVGRAPDGEDIEVESAVMTATGTGQNTAAIPRPNFNADRITHHPYQAGYVPFAFYEGLFRDLRLDGQAGMVAERIVYVTALNGAEFVRGTVTGGVGSNDHNIHNLQNWRLVPFCPDCLDMIGSDFCTASGCTRGYFPNGSASANFGPGGVNHNLLLEQGYGFRIMTVEVVDVTTVRVVIVEDRRFTPSAVTDFDPRPFFISVYQDILNIGENLHARVDIAPFIPPLDGVLGAHDQLHHNSIDEVTIRNQSAGPGGLWTVRTVLGQGIPFDIFRQDPVTGDFDVEFYHDALDGQRLQISNWQINTGLVYRYVDGVQVLIPNPDTWTCAAWPEAGNGAGQNPNVVWDSSSDVNRLMGLRLVRATLLNNNEVVLSFEGTAFRIEDHNLACEATIGGNMFHIRATSVEYADILYGGRALDRGHRHTQHTTLFIDTPPVTPPTDVFLFVTSLEAFGACDGIPVASQQVRFDNIPEQPTANHLTEYNLRHGWPTHPYRGARYVYVQLSEGEFAYGTDAQRNTFRNPNNWRVVAHNNINEVLNDDPDISDPIELPNNVTQPHQAYGMILEFVEWMAPNLVRLMFVGEAELHGNAILSIQPIASITGGELVYPALLRIGDDLRPWLRATNANNVALDHIPVNTAPGATFSFRIHVVNDWFTRYAVELVGGVTANAENAANWSVFRGLDSDQVVAHQTHLPGASAGYQPFAGLGLATGALRNMTLQNQQYIDLNPQFAFEYIDVTLTGPFEANTYVALRPSFDPIGGTVGWIPALVGGTVAFDRTETTVPFPVEYLIIPVGPRVPVYNPDVTIVEGVVAGIQSMLQPFVPEASAMTEEAVIAAMLARVQTVAGAGNVNLTVNLGTFNPAIAGTLVNPLGVDGNFIFTVTVNRGAVTRTTAPRTVAIRAMTFDEDPAHGYVNAAIAAINAMALAPVVEADVNTLAEAIAHVQGLVDALNLANVATTVTGTITPAEGETNGAFVFTVSVVSGQVSGITPARTLVIIADENYVPAECDCEEGETCEICDPQEPGVCDCEEGETCEICDPQPGVCDCEEGETCEVCEPGNGYTCEECNDVGCPVCETLEQELARLTYEWYYNTAWLENAMTVWADGEAWLAEIGPEFERTEEFMHVHYEAINYLEAQLEDLEPGSPEYESARHWHGVHYDYWRGAMDQLEFWNHYDAITRAEFDVIAEGAEIQVIRQAEIAARLAEIRELLAAE